MSRHQLGLRVFIDLLIFLCLLQGWWFALLPLGFIGAWAWLPYPEVIVAGVAYDALFGFVPQMGLRGFLGTIIAFVILAAVAALRALVRK